MGKYIHMIKTCLVLETALVMAKFRLELDGLNENIHSEISLTRLLLVLPVFLGLRFSRESLGAWKEWCWQTSPIWSGNRDAASHPPSGSCYPSLLRAFVV